MAHRRLRADYPRVFSPRLGFDRPFPAALAENPLASAADGRAAGRYRALHMAQLVGIDLPDSMLDRRPEITRVRREIAPCIPPEAVTSSPRTRRLMGPALQRLGRLIGRGLHALACEPLLLFGPPVGLGQLRPNERRHHQRRPQRRRWRLFDIAALQLHHSERGRCRQLGLNDRHITHLTGPGGRLNLKRLRRGCPFRHRGRSWQQLAGVTAERQRVEVLLLAQHHPVHRRIASGASRRRSLHAMPTPEGHGSL